MLKKLIAIHLRSAFASVMTTGKKGVTSPASTARIVLFLILFLYVGAVFVGLFTSVAVSMSAIFLPSNPALYYGILISISFFLLFIFGIFQTKTELFECKDNELLLSLPIKPHIIVAGRIFTVLVYNYCETALIFGPTIVVYAVVSKSLRGVLGGLLVFFLIPLLATALSSAFGFLIAAISKRIKNKQFLTVFFSLLFIIPLVFGYTILIGNSDTFFEGIENSITQIATDLGFVGFVGSIAELSIVPTVVFVIFTLGVCALAYYLISKNYISIATAKTTFNTKKFVMKKEANRGALLALLGKDLKMFISSSTYILNGALGLVFSIVVAVIAVVKKSDIAASLDMIYNETGFNLSGLLVPLLICILSVLLSTNMISCCALSLEGKSLWILKSLPVSPRQVYLSKTLLQIVVCLPFSLICSALFFVATASHLIYLPFLLFVPISFIVGASLMGSFFNVAFPKLEFENEAQPIKQSLASFLTLMSTMVYALAQTVLTFIVSISFGGIVGCVVPLLLNTVLCIIFGALLLGPMTKKYADL